MTVQADFDQIAPLLDDGWSHDSHYHPFLLRQLPRTCHTALEIGCGTGTFARLLAARAHQVLAIDLSPAMIEIARQRTPSLANLEFVQADIQEYALQPNYFECIITISTLHHLPLVPVLHQLQMALAPGGRLLILDLYASEGVMDTVRAVVAARLGRWLRYAKQRQWHASPELRAAWQAHAKHDTYLPVSEIRYLSRLLLPHARIRKHLFACYSLVWTKPT